MKRYIPPAILLTGLLAGALMTGCGKTESTAASNQGAANGKLSPEAESREKQRVSDMAKQYQARAQAGAPH